jgi:hypothetical protein
MAYYVSRELEFHLREAQVGEKVKQWDNSLTHAAFPTFFHRVRLPIQWLIIATPILYSWAFLILKKPLIVQSVASEALASLVIVVGTTAFVVITWLHLSAFWTQDARIEKEVWDYLNRALWSARSAEERRRVARDMRLFRQAKDVIRLP